MAMRVPNLMLPTGREGLLPELSLPSMQYARVPAAMPELDLGAGSGTGGSIVPNLAGPMSLLDPISAVGVGAQAVGAAGQLASGIASAFKKKKTTPQMHAQMRAALPQRARVPMSEQQKALYDLLGQGMFARQEQFQAGQDPISLFAQGLDLTGGEGGAAGDIKQRAMALAEKYAARAGG